MQIKIDENNYIIGYAIIGSIENGIEINDIPKDVQENPHCYKYIDGVFVFNDTIENEQEKEKLLQQELVDIKKWMNDTDYYILKVFRGNWLPDDPRYLDYLNQYNIKKARMDEIVSILKE